MRLTLRFDFFSEEDLCRVVDLRARALQWDLDPRVLPMIAARGKGTPRLALKWLQAAYRSCRAAGENAVTVEHLLHACRLEGCDSLGLGFLEQKYLKLLLNGPRRVNVLASALGSPTRTVTTVIEAFLLRSGMIDKDDQSRRVLTPKGREHLAENEHE